MLRRFLPKTPRFFELFEGHAEIALEASQTMRTLLQSSTEEERKRLIYRIDKLEHDCDKITHQTVDLLRHSFITPFDREEIHALMRIMDDIIDYVKAAAQALVLYEITIVPPEAVQMCEVLLKAQKEVLDLVKMLRTIKGHKKQDHQNHYKEIHRLENEGDTLHRTGIAILFREKIDPLTVIKLKEIYEMLESAIDSCEDVANVIEGIIIEHIG